MLFDIDRAMTKLSPPILRFAPSPNGYLHLGHAYSALRNAQVARELDGLMLVRIENIDIERSRKEFEAAIFEDLAWLGVTWQQPVRRQSEHFSDYACALESLSARGLLYPCFCSRADVMREVAQRPGWPRDPDGAALYPGICKHLSADERMGRLAAGERAALRIDMGEAQARVGMRLGWREYGEGDTARDVSAEPALWGDAVIGRRDIPASYHIAVVVDDALQGITDVVRGEDLFNATSLHRLLQALLGLPAPAYRHHKLLCDRNGAKLSKSTRAKSIRSLRLDGLSAAAVRKRLGFA